MMRPVRADDYEPWLAERILRGEIEAPDEYVIDDVVRCVSCGRPTQNKSRVCNACERVS